MLVLNKVGLSLVMDRRVGLGMDKGVDLDGV